MVSTSKTFKHAYVPPGALVRGRGKSFRAFGSVRVNAEQRSEISPYESEKTKQVRANAEQRTLMGKNKNYNTVTSNQNKLAQKDSLGPPGFDPILEYDASFSNEEAMQGAQRSKISPYEYEKAKKVRVSVEQRTSISKNKNYNAVASNQNKLAQKDSLGPPSFDPILECDASFPDEEAMQGTQRSKISPYEYEKAKNVRVSVEQRISISK
uniref:Uncharacterized protein LOC104234098 n=1 Tax=Nicotiana sylvestris TaxID=4096 RepID=A0A1U7XG30_NICSY|nr:PREDICTED: uncharacterized protein LOC104234098 [Nicotiana sylvestris]